MRSIHTILLLAALAFLGVVYSQTQPDLDRAARALNSRGGPETQIATVARALITPEGHIVIPPTLTANMTMNGTDSQTLTGDITNTPNATGGNLGAKSTYTGIVNSSLVPVATLTNGTAAVKTKALMDDTPAGEWSAIGGGTADPVPANSATFARKGTNGLHLPFLATAVAADGAKFTAFAAENWEAQESVGAWVLSSIVLAAGDVVLKTVDATGDVSFDMPAVAEINKWTWVEFDISALAAGTGDAVTNVKIALSTAGAAKGAFDLYIDGMYKWDATEEVALGLDLVDSPGAVRTFLTQVKTDAGSTAHTWTKATEDTDFFVHSEDTLDFLVTITDLSTFTGFVLVNHKE
jgi:hypothetical protein